jgi:MraZ protein
MFRGSAPTKIDDKGRLKIPTDFRRRLEERYGPTPEVFITSFKGDSARIYPLPVWEAIEDKITTRPSMDPKVAKFLEVVAYYGAQAKLDAQGRLVVPPILRERAHMEGEVVVSGQITYLTVWNRERFERRLEEDALTDEDLAVLGEHGI